MGRQRQLYENAVNCRIRIQPVNFCFQFLLGGSFRHLKRSGINTDFLAAFTFVSDIDLTGRIISDQNDSQSGGYAPCLQRSHAFGDFASQLC